MKNCYKCKLDKPLEDFSPDKANKDGRKGKCKECARAYFTAFRKTQKYKVYSKKYLASEKAMVSRKEATWRAQGINITMEQYNYRMMEQGACCAICGDLHEVLSVDHDHETGKVRGLLCYLCNSGIALLGDNKEGIKNASDYMRVSS